MRITRFTSVTAALLLVCLAVMFCVHVRGASPPGRAAEDPMIPKIEAIFAPLGDARSPGVAVLVRRSGRTVFEHGYGVRDLNSMAAIDPETNFRLASCTKQFTAMAIMLLVHDGKLKYEQSLAEIFPEFPAYGTTITINSLLHHTSGLPDYETLMEQEEKSGGRKWTAENQIHDADVLALLEKEHATQFAPGTKWAYSNSGYVVLGLVVAKVSGKIFGEFLHERIFAPLKMDQTIAYEKGKNEVANRAFGHSRDGSAWKQTDQSSTSATLGDGGVYSSVSDLAKWSEALAKNTLLSEVEMRAALTPATLMGGCATCVACGPGSRCGNSGRVRLRLVSRSVSRACAHVALRRHDGISYLYRTIRRQRVRNRPSGSKRHIDRRAVQSHRSRSRSPRGKSRRFVFG